MGLAFIIPERKKEEEKKGCWMGFSTLMKDKHVLFWFFFLAVFSEAHI